MVGDEPRPGDRPLAGRTRLVPRRTRRPRGARARANGRGHDRAGARGGCGSCASRAALHVVLVQATVTQTLGGIRDRRARRASSAPRASTRRAPMRAGSRPAATRAASRRRSSSAGSPPRKRSARSRSRYAQGLRSCGSGDCEIRFTTQLPWPSSSTVDPTAGGSPSRSQQLVAGRLGDEQAVSGLGGHAGRV